VTPYDLIVTSASRPHLLRPTLESLLRHVDQPPVRVLVHDDAVFPGRYGRVAQVVADSMAILAETGRRDRSSAQHPEADLLTLRVPPDSYVMGSDPPVRLGLALARLLEKVTTEFVLYSQDDFVTVRDLPIRRALALMDRYGIHSIVFHKRAIMAEKQTWRGPWRKEVYHFDTGEWCPQCFSMPRYDGWHQPAADGEGDWDPSLKRKCERFQALTLTDRWNFQTALWRVAPIRAAVAYWTALPSRLNRFRWGQAEQMINDAMDGLEGEVPGLAAPVGAPEPWRPDVRARYQRTFLYGPVGEDRYIRHIGADPADWAGDHDREPPEPGAAERAWAEIRESQRREEAGDVDD